MTFNITTKNLDTFKSAFIAALLAYIFVYGFELTHFTLSIDEEPLDNFLQTLSAGRWGHALLRHYVLPEPYAPFFTTALSIIILSLSAATSSIYIGLNKLQSISFVIMLAALPQLAYQLEFSNQADTVSLSFLLSVVALFMIEKMSVIRASAFIMLTVVSLSVYQSIFLYAATLTCIRITIDAIKGQIIFRQALKKIFVFSLLITLSLIINSFLAKWTALYFDVTISNYLTSMIGWGKRDVYEVLKSVLIFMRDYLTFKSAYGINAFPFVLLSIITIIILSIKRKRGAPLIILMGFATLLSGFLLNFAIGSGMPPRAMTQIPLVFAGLFAAALVISRVRYIGLIISIIFLCIGSAASNKLFYSDFMAREADQNLSNQIITTIYNNIPNFDEKVTPVFFYGSYSPLNSWKIPSADVFGSSFFDWDGGNNRRMYMYLSTANLIKLKEPNEIQVKNSIVAAKDMPSWPNRNSIKIFDGVVVVKLSDKLSPYNR